MGMIWSKKERRFRWPFILLVVYSTLSLVVFDLAWRHVEMGFVQLALIGMIGWTIGAAIIFVKGWKS